MLLIPLQHLYITTNYIQGIHLYCNLLLICWMWQSAALFTLLIFSHNITIWKHSNNTLSYFCKYMFLPGDVQVPVFSVVLARQLMISWYKKWAILKKKYMSQSWYSGIQFGVTGFIRMLVFITGLACSSQEHGIATNSCFFTCKSVHYSRRVGYFFLQFSKLYFSYLNISIFI